MFPLYRNQSTDFLWKDLYWFLYKRNLADSCNIFVSTEKQVIKNFETFFFFGNFETFERG